jgi:putative membrane protein
MTTLRIAANELRRLSTGRMPRLALVAVLLVPLLYGGLYLYANWDPYDNLDEVPAALVVDDHGAKTGDQRLDVGRDVAADLTKKGTFDWHTVSAQDAEKGVRDGRFTFAVTLPADFSAALASPADFHARQGMIVLTTNDANGYTGSTLAKRLVDEIRRSVAAKAGEQAANRLLLGFSTIQEKTQQAANGATQLADGAKQADEGAATLADGTRELATGQRRLLDGSRQLASGTATAATGARRLDAGTTQLAAGLEQLRQQTLALPAQTAQLASGARQVADGNAQVSREVGRVAATAQQVVDRLQSTRAAVAQRLRDAGLTEEQVNSVLAPVDQLLAPIVAANAKLQKGNTQVKALADGARKVSDGAGRLADRTPQLTAGIGRAAGGAHQASAGAHQLATGTARLGDGSRKLRDGLSTAAAGSTRLAGGAARLHDGSVKVAEGSRTLAGRLDAAAGQIPDPDDPTRDSTARVIGDPVAVRTVGQANAGTYGAGLAPFFLGLALWVGAFVLYMLVRPLSRRALAAGQAAYRVALAGWLPAAALGAAQAVLLFGFASFVIGVDAAHPWLALAFMLVTALTFTAVVHGLNAYFGPAGRFVALILLVLQLTTAGGTFPWQTTPDPLHPLHVMLPLSYVVDGLRHLLYGGTLTSVWPALGVLAAYLAGGLALAALAGRRQRVWSGARLQPELVL